MKPLLWFGILALLAALEARADNFYSPLLCPIEDISLHVKNNSDEVQDFWLQDLGSTPFQELHIPLKALGQLTILLRDYYTHEATAVAIKTRTPALSFTAFCKKTQTSWTLNNHHSPWKSAILPTGISQVDLHLVNLSHQNNPVEIQIETVFGSTRSQSLVLPESFASDHLSLTLPWGVRSLKIRALGRLNARALLSQNTELLLEEEKVPSASVPQARYFLFKSMDPQTTDSFVVPITSAQLIQESLYQINHPTHARLLVARIEKSLAANNRDMTSPLKSPWSWQVVEAQNYADFAHISCDGTPNLVEERLNSWIFETGGTICFWSYRIERELGPDEIRQSLVLSRPGPGFPQHKH